MSGIKHSLRSRQTFVFFDLIINNMPSAFVLQIIIQRGADGGFGFSVTGTAPVTVSTVQPSK